jgi:hypothetical protein
VRQIKRHVSILRYEGELQFFSLHVQGIRVILFLLLFLSSALLCEAKNVLKH